MYSSSLCHTFFSVTDLKQKIFIVTGQKMRCVSGGWSFCLMLVHLSCTLSRGQASVEAQRHMSEVGHTETGHPGNSSMARLPQSESSLLNNTSGSARSPITCLELSQNQSIATSNHSFELDAEGCDDDCCVNIAVLGARSDGMEKLKSSFQFICQGILRPAIAIPGFVCNVVNIWVLRRDGKSSANTLFLIGLSIADLSYLFIVLVAWGEYLLQVFNYPVFVVVVTGIRIYWIRSFASLTTGRMSNILIVVLSLERFVVVKFPFATKTFWLSRHPVKVMLGLSVCVIVVFFPNIFRREYIEVFDPVLNQSSAVIVRSDFDINNEEFLLIHTYLLLVVLRCFPVFLVVVLNLAIIITLKSSHFSLGAGQSSDDKRRLNELKVTRMLLVISLLFFICVMPGLIHTLLGNGLPGYNFFGYNSQLFKIFFYIYPVFDTLNSTVNFFVYVFMSDNFRQIFLNIFRRKSGSTAERLPQTRVSMLKS